MSALPKAVQKQIAEANQLAEEIMKAQTSPSDQPPSEEPPAAPSTEAAQKPSAETASESDDGSESKPEPAPTATPAQPDGWEQKYKVLQGKYNAEVPRLQRVVNDLNGRLENLTSQLTATQGMLASLSQQRGSAPSEGAPSAAPTKLVKDEEIRDFGPELYDFVKRAAMEAVAPQMDSKLKPLQQKVDQVAQTAQQVVGESNATKQERVIAALDAQVADWRELNKNPEFLNWLDEDDAYTGVQRGVLLKQAYQRHDAPRVVAFFKGFLNENAVVAPPPAPAAPARPQRKMDEFVAPGTAKAGTTGAPDEAGKRIYTESQIAKFYHDASQGKYRSRPDEYRAMEREFVNAAREGRVVPR